MNFGVTFSDACLSETAWRMRQAAAGGHAKAFAYLKTYGVDLVGPTERDKVAIEKLQWNFQRSNRGATQPR